VGSIEGGLLRCPWHGYDYCPLSGDSPGGFGDSVPTHPVDRREDGIYVGLGVEESHIRTVSDVMAETLANWGVRHVFAMVGHSNLGLADAIRRQVEAGRMDYIGIRHEGAAAFAASAYAKLTGTPAACLTIAGPGATNLLTGLWDANVDRAPVLALAVKHATPGVSHLVFPDEVQTIPAAEEAQAGTPDGRIGDARIHPPTEALAEAQMRIAASSRRRVPCAGRATRRSRHHDIQGQGPDPRRASARLWRARSQWHPGGVLGDGRG
jgi:pyruvate oxidase